MNYYQIYSVIGLKFTEENFTFHKNVYKTVNNIKYELRNEYNEEFGICYNLNCSNEFGAIYLRKDLNRFENTNITLITQTLSCDKIQEHMFELLNLKPRLEKLGFKNMHNIGPELLYLKDVV